MVEQIITIGHFIVNKLREGDQWDVGDVVDYVAKLFPHLFNIFETADVETPGCRPVSAYALPCSIIDISNE
jgi:hypothetical protein